MATPSRADCRSPGCIARTRRCADLEGARPREVDVESLDHARRPRREHDHAVGEEHRLADPVGDKEHRLFRLLPDAQELEVHPLPGQGVEGAEGLVHQQQLGVVNEGAGDGDALLHAAGELLGIAALEALEAHQLEKTPRLGLQRGAVHLEDLDGQQDIVEDLAPVQQQGLLKDKADLAPGIELLLVDKDLAGALLEEPRDDLEQRCLAAARRADKAHELLRVDVKGDAAEGLELAVPGAIGLFQSLDRKKRFPVRHGFPLGGRPEDRPRPPSSIYQLYLYIGLGRRSAVYISS